MFFPVVSLLVVMLLGCATKEKNPNLAVFDGGSVKQDEYVARYLKSSKSNPDKKPSLEKLSEFVSGKALATISLLEAKSLKLENDTTFQQSARLGENDILYEAYMMEIASSVITDSIIQKFYNEYSPQYEMKYILRVANDQVSEKFKAASKDTINWLSKKLKSGVSFEELAKKYSQDGSTRSKGGSLGYLIPESLGDDMLRAAMRNMEQHTFSEPIKGLAGYYILYKGQKREVSIPPFEKIKPRIWKSLRRSRRHKIDEIVTAKLKYLEVQKHFKIDEQAINKLKRLAGWKPGIKKYQRLDFDKIEIKDLFSAFARYDGGVILTFELFPSYRRKPRDEEELYENVNALKKKHLFSQHARNLGFTDKPELLEKLIAKRNASLRGHLFDLNIQKRVTDEGDSFGVNSAQKLAEMRKKSKGKFKTARAEYEIFLKDKYNFEYITSNFDGAIEEAEKQAKLQNTNTVPQ